MLSADLKPCHPFSIQNLLRSSVQQERHMPNANAVITSASHHMIKFNETPKTVTKMGKSDSSCNVSTDSGCSVNSHSDDENVDVLPDSPKMGYGLMPAKLHEDIEESSEVLPLDPRLWSKQQVKLWLSLITRQHNLPPVSADRFPFNGKALCFMTPQMFLYRVPYGGMHLYTDFCRRIKKVLGSKG